jgi:hypothetical protein
MLLEPPRIYESTVDHAVGTYRQMVMTTWRCRVTPEAVLSVRRRSEASFASDAKGIVFLVVVEESAQSPSKDARQSLAELLRAHSEQIAGGAMIFEGSGFRAAAVRSVATSMAILARTEYAFKVFPSVENAAIWLGPLSGNVLAPDEIVEAAQAIRNARLTG